MERCLILRTKGMWQALSYGKTFCVFVCMYCIRPVLKDFLLLFLKSHIWHGPDCVTELGMSKGLCSRLLHVRVGLCCTLGRIMQFLPELEKQCICVGFTKVMVGVQPCDVFNLSCRLVIQNS